MMEICQWPDENCPLEALPRRPYCAIHYIKSRRVSDPVLSKDIIMRGISIHKAELWTRRTQRRMGGGQGGNR